MKRSDYFSLAEKWKGFAASHPNANALSPEDLIRLDPMLPACREAVEILPLLPEESSERKTYDAPQIAGQPDSSLLSATTLPFMFFVNNPKNNVIEHDNEYLKLEDEKKKQWLKNNQVKDFSSKQGLDFLYGSLNEPTASSLHKDIHQQIKEANEFYKKYQSSPDDGNYKEYKHYEKYKKLLERYGKGEKETHEKIKDDQIVARTQGLIQEEINDRFELLKKEDQRLKDKHFAEEAKKELAKKVEVKRWDEFVEKYPEKAKSYAERHETPEIRNAYARYLEKQIRLEKEKLLAEKEIQKENGPESSNPSYSATQQQATTKLESLANAQNKIAGEATLVGSQNQPLSFTKGTGVRTDGFYVPFSGKKSEDKTDAATVTPPKTRTDGKIHPSPQASSQQLQQPYRFQRFISRIPMPSFSLPRSNFTSFKPVTGIINSVNSGVSNAGSVINNFSSILKGAKTIASGARAIGATGGAIAVGWPVLAAIGALVILVLLIIIIFNPGGGGTLSTPTTTPSPGPGSSSGGDIASCTFYRGGDSVQGLKFGNPQMASLISSISSKVGVPAAIVAGIMRVETASAVSSTDPSYLTNDYDAHTSGVAYGVMQFTPGTFQGVFNGNADFMSQFGKIEVKISIDPQASMAPNNIFRIYSITDSIIAAALKVKADKYTFNKNEPWTKEAINYIATRYYGCLRYGPGGCSSGMYSYGDDLWKSYSNCSSDTTPSTIASSCPLNGKRVIGCGSFMSDSKFNRGICTGPQPINRGHCGTNYGCYKGSIDATLNTRRAHSIDVDGPAGEAVYLPTLNNQAVDWKYASSLSYPVSPSDGGGYGHVFVANLNGDKWILHLTHTNQSLIPSARGDGIYKSGDSATTIASTSYTHVHINIGKNPEANDGGSGWLNPEDLGMCVN